jgi:heterodisulfide reductase subunit C
MRTFDEQSFAFDARTGMLRPISAGRSAGLVADAWEGALVILSGLHAEDDIIAQIAAISGQDVRACYQCGKCTAGCPLASAMDLMPNQILRLLQLGEHEQALRSRTIWQCASCLTCAARCPKDVDPARVMDALRTLLTRRGLAHVEIPKISAELLAEAPQQALIGGFRKFVGY